MGNTIGGGGYEGLLSDGGDAESNFQGQRAILADLARRESEQEQIREAAAQVEAAMLARSLLSNDIERPETSLNRGDGYYNNNNGVSQADEMDNEPLEFLLPGHYNPTGVGAQDSMPPLGSLQSLPPSLIDGSAVNDNSIYSSPLLGNNRNYDDWQSDDPEQDDRSLLYTEGGLVFLNGNNNNRDRFNDWLNSRDAPDPVVTSQRGFYDAPLTKEDEESLMYLKRFIGSPVAPNEELELLREERERPQPAGRLDDDMLLYGNQEDAENAGGNGYEELTSFLGDNYGGGNMGFERQERLDVKKPGPWYRTVNNYAFDKEDKVSVASTFA